jgi:CDP-diacylglycerol--glycerol-3-phosphate 3-phosphatidyltransferase
MPVLLMQMVNGSILTTVLRLRAARRELAQKREQEQADLIDLPTRPILTAVAA